MARLLIVEEALKNRSGHWYEYNRAIAQEARKLGHDVTLLAHRDIEPDIREELSAEAFFPVTSWDQGYYHPSAWRRYLGILRHNFSIARLLQRHFKKQSEAYDVVLVPTTVIFHWLAWRWLVFRGAGKYFHRLVLTTRNNAGEYDPESKNYTFNSSAKILAKVLKSFRRPVEDGIVELASDSSVLCEQYNRLCGLPFHPYPHPRPTDHLSFPKLKERKEVVFSALGPPRYEKGSDLIVEAIQTILQENPEFPGRFVLHWTNQVHSPVGTLTLLPPEFENYPKVELIRESLSSEDYQRRIEESDVILVPYRRSQYHARLSGIVIEAFQSGVPCICISDTWLDDCRKKIGKGLSLDKENVEDLIRAILEMTFNISTYQFNGDEVISARHAHSPKTFISLLLQTQV